MDRRLLYVGAIPQDLDALVPQRNTLKALGWLAQGAFGTNTVVDGLECSPSVPADLTVHIAPGAIYQLDPVDDAAFGSMPPDLAHNIVKQGLNPDAAPLTLTPPPTPGQAINYLVQAQILEQDLEATVLPYFNPASLIDPNAVAWSGPSNSGVSQPVTRRASVQISLKQGLAATAGTQTTPAPDVGYVGLYVITVAQGQTQVTGASIAIADNAPFLWLKLPQVPKWVQGGSYAWAEDSSAVANQIVVELDPLPDAVVKGFGIRCKVANAVTGATTILIKRKSLADLGPFAVVRAAGSAIVNGDISANQVVDLVFDGTSFRDITGTTINNNVGTLTAQSGEGIEVKGDGTVNQNYPGLSAATPVAADLFAFYSVSQTHHKVLTFEELLALCRQAPSDASLVHYGVDIGVANAPKMLPTPTAKEVLPGFTIFFIAAYNSPGPATIEIQRPNLSSIIAPLKRSDGSALNKRDIKGGKLIGAIFDGTQFRIFTSPSRGFGPDVDQYITTQAIGGLNTFPNQYGYSIGMTATGAQLSNGTVPGISAQQVGYAAGNGSWNGQAPQGTYELDEYSTLPAYGLYSIWHMRWLRVQ